MQRTEDTLLFSIIQGSEEIVDDLLKNEISVPDIACAFHITVNSLPLCVADLVFGVAGSDQIHCGQESLHQSLLARKRIKAIYPGAVVAIKAGSCPKGCSIQLSLPFTYDRQRSWVA